jgi:Fic family protein
MAYIYAEQDDLDLTYFIDYHLRKIMIAVEHLDEYVRHLSQLNKKMKSVARTKYKLNDRQIGLLQFFYKKRDEHTTSTIHQNIYGVGRITANKDLKGLERMGFIVSEKIGKEVFYYGSDKLSSLF